MNVNKWLTILSWFTTVIERRDQWYVTWVPITGKDKIQEYVSLWCCTCRLEGLLKVETSCDFCNIQLQQNQNSSTIVSICFTNKFEWSFVLMSIVKLTSRYANLRYSSLIGCQQMINYSVVICNSDWRRGQWYVTWVSITGKDKIQEYVSLWCYWCCLVLNCNEW